MRISRPCYDKPHRCPGWAGGGWKYARKRKCVNGSIPTLRGDPSLWAWKFRRCPDCGVIVLPYAVKFIDPSHWFASARLLVEAVIGGR